ncbi:AfsR/SARP family transcriptional regulator [Streptomyces sp. NRRL F-4489]|uniref:AfsR/SARP family transcriptional regulator n=1 Tax=Streptomyces sp. NRRL F-4489 TaxID=1609095 RepID=UPI002D21B217|nr:BTAD domain-containing putative transcriptional regulator [Streptomyces sp. NRRL F-4489]
MLDVLAPYARSEKPRGIRARKGRRSYFAGYIGSPPGRRFPPRPPRGCPRPEGIPQGVGRWSCPFKAESGGFAGEAPVGLRQRGAAPGVRACRSARSESNAQEQAHKTLGCCMVMRNGPVYRILGPLEVVFEGAPECRVPRGRTQTVLIALLLDANRVVSAEYLMEAVWGENPPLTARTQIQTCISGLRALLSRSGRPSVIATRGPGYVIQVAEGELDSQVFLSGVSEADGLIRKGCAGEAQELLRSVLSLWRGPALSGVGSDRLMQRAEHVEEARLAASETYAGLRLDAGRHAELVGELRALLAEHPLRERTRGQLMLALHRSGRTAEALETYRDGRRLAVEELGLEPGDELREVQRAILSGEAGVSGTGTAAGSPPAAVEPPVGGEVSGQAAVVVADGADTPVVPCQLPPDVVGFVGRGEQLRVVEELLTGGEGGGDVRAVALTGPPGMGKSALAVHAAHRIAGAFPDGQLYCDLGRAPGRRMGAGEVLGRFLRALGVPGEGLPASCEERAALYRRFLAGRRILVVLDDVATEEQLAPLLPGTGGSAVLVTGSPRAAGLPGVRTLTVDVLEDDEVLRMLAGAIGERRVANEARAAETLGRIVGRLPLALRIVAARLAARPHWSLAWMVERLSDEHRRLDELAYGDLAIRTGLALSYEALDHSARRLLRLLSLLDGPSTGGWVAAALLDVDLFQAVDLLDQLVEAQLLEVVGSDPTAGPRYRLPGLIRLFAREELARHRDADDTGAALARVIGGWLSLVDEAHRRIYGGDFTVLHGPAPRRRPDGLNPDRALADPLGWLESERANVCAAVGLAARTGQAEACWDLATGLVSLFEARCYYEDWEATHLQALESVRVAGAERGRAALLCSLGSLHLSRSQLKAARQRLVPALEAFTALGDVHGCALARRNLALLEARQQDVEAALGHFWVALGEFWEAGDHVGAASVLVHMARLEGDRGNWGTAGGYLNEALDICQGAGSRRVELQVRYVLSDLMQRQGRYEEAEEVLTDLLRQVRERRDVAGESRVLHRLGSVSARLGRNDDAQRLLRAAIATRERIMDRVGAAEVRLELAQLEVDLEDRVVQGPGSPSGKRGGSPYR